MPKTGATEPRASVLITSNFANDTGYAWRFIFGVQSIVARALCEHGISVCLSFAQIREPITTIDRDIPFQAFEFDPGNITLRSTVNLVRQIVRRRIRFVYLTDMPAWHWLYLVMRMMGVRYIVSHVHVSVADPNPASAARGIRRIFKRAIQLTPLRADAVYAVSSFVAQRLAVNDCCPSSRVHVIHNGIDLSKFACERPVAKSQPLRIFLGARATKFKGVQTLIEATRLLLKRDGIPPFVVHYAGDGPDIESFRTQAELAELRETFLFLGALPTTVSEVCAADVVVVPSIWGEAYSLSVVEAMAAGKAIVVTRAGALPEIVGGPDTGLFVPPGDADALANAIASLLTDEVRRAYLGVNARRRSHELFGQSSLQRALTNRIISDFHLDRSSE